jgi:hypothetical protein
MQTRLLWLIFIALGVLLASACAGQQQPTATPTDTATATPTATPTPLPIALPLGPAGVARDPSRWVGQRIDAVADLYRITPEGRRVLATLDVRQMRGQPGFFGSYGYRSWTGVGEAKPTQVIHEISHAYWGAFPVTGHPDLLWDVPEGQSVAPAMLRYHEDAVRFLAQPPDAYEPFRQRLKNLPQLSSANLDPLYHTIEADMVSMVGGDLELIPHILRKYFDRFLAPGPHFRWDEAVSWYLGVSGDDKQVADRYLGFQHLDLRAYRYLKPSDSSGIDEADRQILEHEQRQRLWDFAAQFDLVSQDAEKAADFGFWRRYLREIAGAHAVHSRFLAASGLPQADAMARAFDFTVSVKDLPPHEKAAAWVQQMSREPLQAQLLPALDNATLVELFSPSFSLPPEATEKGIRPFVERLKRFIPQVESILSAGAVSPQEGAAALSRFLPNLDLDNREETDLFFDLFLRAGGETAKRIAVAQDQGTNRRLLAATPVLLRRLLGPVDLARALDITSDSTPEQLAEGITLLTRHPSGNFRIDEPFLDEVNQVLARRAGREPARMLGVIAASPLPMERFMYQHPLEAVAILSTDMEITLGLVEKSDPVVLPPARFIYALIFASPLLAAEVVEHLDIPGGKETVLESLASIAYDKARSEANPDLPIDLHNDGIFLQKLSEAKGRSWLAEQLRATVVMYRGRVQAHEAPTDFLEAYRATLDAAAGTVGEAVQPGLLTAIETAFEPKLDPGD